MSRATLYVRFPDGQVKYGIYNGTVDIAQPWLVDTPTEAWDIWHGGNLTHYWQESQPEGEPVDVATDYGGGFSWQGRATTDRLVDGFEPFELDSHDGLPEWAVYPPAQEQQT
jgi:hypothetical protein